MSQHPLLSFSDDITQLSIAGTSSALKTPKLQNHYKTLTELSKQVTSLVPVRDQLSQLLEGASAKEGKQIDEREKNFLQVLIYAQQIKRSLSKIDLSGELSAVADAVKEKVTLISSMRDKEIHNLIEVFTQAGTGRLEAVRNHPQFNQIQDIRLLSAMLRTLEGNNHELSRVVAEELLPRYGVVALRELTRAFNKDGNNSDALRLRSICIIDPVLGKSLCYEALQGKSIAVRVMAIELLRNLEDPEKLFDLAKTLLGEKAKDIRYSALKLLSKVSETEAMSLIFDEYDRCDHGSGEELNTIVQVLQLILIADKEKLIFKKVLSEIELLFNGPAQIKESTPVAKKSTKKKSKEDSPLCREDIIFRLSHLLRTLGTPNCQNDQEIIDTLFALVGEQRPKNYKGASVDPFSENYKILYESIFNTLIKIQSPFQRLFNLFDLYLKNPTLREAVLVALKSIPSDLLRTEIPRLIRGIDPKMLSSKEHALLYLELMAPHISNNSKVLAPILVELIPKVDPFLLLEWFKKIDFECPSEIINVCLDQFMRLNYYFYTAYIELFCQLFKDLKTDRKKLVHHLIVSLNNQTDIRCQIGINQILEGFPDQAKQILKMADDYLTSEKALDPRLQSSFEQLKHKIELDLKNLATSD